MITQYDGVLSGMYMENDYPADRYASNEAAKKKFARVFNDRVGETFTADEIIQRLIQLRKTKSLPLLGRQWRGPLYGVKIVTHN